MDIQRLRRETSIDHEKTEEIMPFMKGSLTKEEYVVCLHRMYGVIAAWEESVCLQAPDWVRALLAVRGRKQLLERDLNSLGIQEPSRKRATLPSLDDEASFLGVMYVIEGSTLGGQIIARHVEQVLGMEPGIGDSFFRGYGLQTGPMWKEFCEVLRVRVPDKSAPDVIQSASAMFTVFRSWMLDIDLEFPQ